ncbi:MAG: alcohol dehydrogenase class IV [Halieaceae bacterium]
MKSSELESLTASWNYPTAMRVGVGTVAELPGFCRGLGMASPLLVTDPGLAGMDMTRDVLAQLKAAGLAVACFSAIKGNPTGDNVEAGARMFREGGHDGVVAFGGGSAIDAGKSIALLAGQSGSLFDYADVDDNWTRVDAAAMAPVVAVPTTAGTGSEVGRAAVITDECAQCKRIIFHPGMLPAQVILDPELTVGLPPHLTAATGMDALSHNLEALSATSFHPMAFGIALEGIRLVHDYLPRACADGNDLEARMQMLVASSMGATAFQRGLGAMHALAHSLGAVYDAHHGLLNAILMPYVLKANAAAVDSSVTRAAIHLGLSDASFGGFLHWVLAFREQLGIPHSLAAIGIDDSEADRIGAMAVLDATAAGNPIAFSVAEYTQLFRRAVHGDL